MSDTESLEPIGDAEEEDLAHPVAADEIRAEMNFLEDYGRNTGYVP